VKYTSRSLYVLQLARINSSKLQIIENRDRTIDTRHSMKCVCVLLYVPFNDRVKKKYFKNGSPNKASLFVTI